LAERHFHPTIRFVLALSTIVLCLAALEGGLRYRDWPKTVVSGWRASAGAAPLNQFGWRGQAAQKRSITDFVVVLTGASNVECLSCPADETLDVILENALRSYNPKARVVTLGAPGYGQDQEFLALQDFFSRSHADLVINWASPEQDVPANTFRMGLGPGDNMAPKPTFAWIGNEIRGPTEGLGSLIYRTKIATLLWPLFINLDRNWTIVLPPADPGTPVPAGGMAMRLGADTDLEQQRSNWSIWLKPRPARVAYGIALTKGLFRHIRDLATLNGARFAVLSTPSASDAAVTMPVALEHDGHWYVADPATHAANVAEVIGEFDPIVLPIEANPPPSPANERQIMVRLAEALDQRELLTEMRIARPRH
jgi:hypothetical protein